MATINVTDADFEEKVFKSTVPVLVDFYADWCGPCKMAEPVLEELSDEYQGKLTIVKLNVDQNQETAQKYSVMSIPTTIIFKGEQEIARQTGFSGKPAFEEMIKKAL